MEDYLTVREFCTRTRMSAATLYRKLAEREITAIKSGRRTLIAVSEAKRWQNTRPSFVSTDRRAA
jgi:excisionase family DNA binding protein